MQSCHAFVAVHSTNISSLLCNIVAMNMNHVNHVNMISNNVVPPSAMAGTLVNHTATMILEKSLENNEEMLDMLQMQQQDEYSDNWRFQIHPQDLFITPDMNSMYKPFVVSATLDNASPILLHHHASPDLQQQQQHFFNSISMSMNSLENNNQNAAAADQQSAAAPWQVWDQQEDSPPHSAFSLFSPTLPFVSVFDNPVSSSSTTTATGSPADKLTLNTTLNQIHQHQQQQMSGDPNTAASDSLFSFIPATPTAATNLESPTTPQESTSGVVRRHKRQRSSLMSPLTLQFSCLPLHSPIMMDSASFSEMQSSPILTSPFMDHSAFNAPSVSGGAGGAGGSAAASLMEKSNSNNTSSPSSASGKKTRRDKDGKQQKCFPCDLCSSTFSRNHDLKRHIRYVHHHHQLSLFLY